MATDLTEVAIEALGPAELVDDSDWLFCEGSDCQTIELSVVDDSTTFAVSGICEIDVGYTCYSHLALPFLTFEKDDEPDGLPWPFTKHGKVNSQYVKEVNLIEGHK